MKKGLLILSAFISLHFAASGQAVPNGDFENWNTYNNYGPDSGWYNSNVQSLMAKDTLTVWSVTGVSGQAIHIQTAIVGGDTLQAWITNSVNDPRMGIGGVPYSQMPTGMTGYYRYNLPVNDSAGIVVIFKKSGAMVSISKFMIRNATGSVSSFTPFSFPITTLSVVPDTVIIAITSSNLFGSGLQSGSWLEVDELAFTGTGITQAIPDGNFDTWTNNPILIPTGWAGDANFSYTGIAQSSDAYHGSFSCKLVSSVEYDHTGTAYLKGAELTTGHFSPNNGPAGGLPYTGTSDTLFGYYKYSPVGIDSGVIGVTLLHSGSTVGGFYSLLPAAAGWTLFKMPFTAFTTPDTLRIDVQSSTYNSPSRTAGSTLEIDQLWLKSQPLGILEMTEAANVLVYPVPANDLLNFRFGNEAQGAVAIRLYDMMGRTIDQRSVAGTSDKITFQVGHLPTGMYFYEISSQGVQLRNKFIKQ